MAFTPATLGIIVQPIGGGGMRFVSYRSDDSIATVSSSDYFTAGESYGLRLSDLIFVSPVTGTTEPFILVVSAVDSDGNVTATQTAFDAELTALAGLDKSEGNFIVGNGTTWTVESGATARASLGLGSAAVASLLDEDDMASDSATAVPSQQSVKAFAERGVRHFSTMTALKAASSSTSKVDYLTASGQEGIFVPTAGDYSAAVTLDTYEGMYAKADDSASSSLGLVRQFSGPPKASWFGITPAATSNSARLVSASKVALLANQRVIDIGDTDIPLDSVPDIHATANVRFVGKARFTDYQPFYRFVGGRSDRSPALSAANDSRPEKHFWRANAAFRRGETINIVIFGDSTWTEAQNTDIAHQNLKVNRLRAWAMRQWPGVTINVINRAIGGRSFDHWDQVDAGLDSATLTASYSWFSQGNTWISQIAPAYSATNPAIHLVVIGFGRNHNTGPDIADLTGIRDALSPTCDLLWEVAGPPSLTKDPDGYQASWWANQIATGGLVRTFAQYYDHAIIDTQRWVLAHVFDFDIRASAVLAAVETFTPTGTPSADTTSATQCFAGQALITFDGTNWGANDVLQVGIAGGGISGASYLQISKTGGNYGFQWKAVSTGSLNSGSVVNSGVSIPSSSTKLVVEFNDGVVSVWDTENASATTSMAPIYTARFVGKTSLFYPYVYVRNGSGTATLVLSQVRFRHGYPVTYAGSVTDQELFETGSYVGGNAINHETSILDTVLDSLWKTLRGNAVPELPSYRKAGPVYVPASTTETEAAAVTIPGYNFVAKGCAATFEGTCTFLANGNTKKVYLKLTDGTTTTTIASYSGTQSGGYVMIRGRMVVDNALPDTAWVRFKGEVVTTAAITPFNTALRIDNGAGTTRFLIDETLKLTMEGSGTSAEIALQDFEWKRVA